MANLDSLTATATNLQAGEPKSTGTGFRQDRIFTWDRQVAINPDASIPDVSSVSIFREPLTRAENGLYSVRAPKTGAIVGISVWITEMVGAGSAVFNISKNGAALLSGAEKLTFTSGTTQVSRSVNIPVGRGDLLSLDLEAATGATIITPIYFLIEIL